MRHLLAVAVLPFVLLAACSSSSPEPSASTSEAVGACPEGEGLTCDQGLHGPTCKCAPLSCSFTIPTPPSGENGWIESWAINGRTSCPTVTATTGSWANLGVTLGPTEDTFNGIPGDESGLPPDDCTSVFGAGASCCTYVWWPAGYPSAGTWPSQDSKALCTANGEAFTAVEHLYCPPGPPPKNKCAQPGTGGCATCVHFTGP